MYFKYQLETPGLLLFLCFFPTFLIKKSQHSAFKSDYFLATHRTEGSPKLKIMVLFEITLLTEVSVQSGLTAI